jgi:hypothetical protein
VAQSAPSYVAAPYGYVQYAPYYGYGRSGAAEPARCLDPPRCTREAAPPPSFRGHVFPIAGVRDPFDYLR